MEERGQERGQVLQSCICGIARLDPGTFDPGTLCDSGTDERHCDAQARKLLKQPRSSSVFPAPARQSLQAADYQDALVINRESTGRGLSKKVMGSGLTFHILSIVRPDPETH